MQNYNIPASLCSWAGYLSLTWFTTLPADDSHEILCLICYFWKSGKIRNRRMLQIIGGALRLNSFLASGDFCHLLITFVNSLDPDQDWHSVGFDLDPNDFDTLIEFLKEFFENVHFENSQTTTKVGKLPSMQRVKSNKGHTKENLFGKVWHNSRI